MKDELIQFETAKLAYQKDFRFKSEKVYDEEGTLTRFSFGLSTITDFNGRIVFAPTQSLLQRWLREVHNIVVSMRTGDELKDNKFYYTCIVSHTRGNGIISIILGWATIDGKPIQTYEQLLEKGLLEGLKLLP